MDYIENDLADYLKMPVDAVVTRARTASVALRTQWQQYQGKPIDFYRDNEQYLFDELDFNAAPGWISRVIPALRVKTDNHLDIGCGIGTLCLLKGLQGHRTTGYDVNEATLAFAHYRAKKYSLEVSFISTEPDYSQYDLITSIDVLEHIEDLGNFLWKMGQGAKQGTLFYHYDCFGFQDISPMHFDHSAHIRGWLEDAGFHIISPQWAIKKALGVVP